MLFAQGPTTLRWSVTEPTDAAARTRRDRTQRRLLAELRATGFTLSQDACLVRGATPWPENEVACVILDPNQNPVLLTILLRDDPQPRTFELEVGSSGRLRASVLRAVEFLRAQFDARSLTQPFTPPPLPALPKPWPAPPAPVPSVWTVRLGLHVGWPGGAAPELGATAGVTRWLGPRWALGARWIGPTWGAQFAQGSSRAHVSSMAAMALLGGALLRGERVTIAAYATGGGMWSGFEGESEDPALEVTQVGVASALVGGRVEADWWWSERLGAHVGVGASWALPRVEVELGRGTVGALAAPWVTGAVGLVTRW